MTRNQLTTILLLFFSLFITTCNTTSPQKTFEIAFLNSNMIVGFAGNRMSSELENPSVKLTDDGKTVSMQRKDVIQSKIDFSEDVLKKLKSLKETDDSREMITASSDLYNFILPVYKNEYQQLAKLYDEQASKEAIESQTQAIRDKYYDDFEKRYNKLIALSKTFAQQHNITVHWND